MGKKFYGVAVTHDEVQVQSVADGYEPPNIVHVVTERQIYGLRRQQLHILPSAYLSRSASRILQEAELRGLELAHL